MKHLYIILIICLTTSLYGQGNITSIEIIPASPAITDSVYLVAHLSFSTGSCDQQSFSASVVGNNVVASSHHCVGALTVICSASDTVNLGVLAPGTYNVDLTLTSGAAPIPCTPGFAPDDNDTTSFIVIAPTEIQTHNFDFDMAPNPAYNELRISGKSIGDKSNMKVAVYTQDGKLLIDAALPQNGIVNVSELSAGIYFVQVGNSSVKKLLKID